MKKFYILLLALFAGGPSFSQSVKKDSAVSATLTNCVFVDDPQFPGGQEAFIKYFSKNIKNIKIYNANEPLKRIILTFIIERDGTLINARILKSSDNAEVDKQILRLAEASPKWNPATTNGKTVRVQYSIPLFINISSE